MTRIASHLRQECGRIDWESMYYALINEKLTDADCGRVKEAMDRCMSELEFIPNSKQVKERLPYQMVESKAPDNLKLIREFYEPYTHDLRLHVFEYEGNYRQARIERIV